MARTFLSASSQKLLASSTPVSAVPLSMACWWRPVSATVAGALFSINDNATNEFRIDQTSGSKIRSSCFASGSGSTTDTSTSNSSGVWCHAAIVCASATSRSVYLNGGGKTTDTNSRTPGGVNRINVACQVGSSSFANGDIAECAIWNVALADADIAALAAGVAAWFVRPDALVFYAPLLQGYSPEIDIVGGRTLTLTSTPALIDGPPIRYRSGLGALCA